MIFFLGQGNSRVLLTLPDGEGKILPDTRNRRSNIGRRVDKTYFRRRSIFDWSFCRLVLRASMIRPMEGFRFHPFI
jgi:hypothetical protein